MAAAKTILHLSDLHFGWHGEPAALARRQLCLEGVASAVKQAGSDWAPSVVVITGDIGWRGTHSDYAEARTWLLDLLERLTLPQDSLVICPGNHDVDRASARFARPSTAQEADTILDLPLQPYLRTPFAAYERFCEDLGVIPFVLGKEESFLAGTRSVGGVSFLALNSAWFARGDDDRNNLWLGLPHVQLAAVQGVLSEGQRPNFTVTLAHHPPAWLTEKETRAETYPPRPNTTDYVARRCDLLLTGHTHGEASRLLGDHIAPAAARLDLVAGLSADLELCLCVDGLDEVDRQSASRLLRYLSAATSSWPNLKVIVSGRPTELHGVDLSTWGQLAIKRLDDHRIDKLLLAEALADSNDHAAAIAVADRIRAEIEGLPHLGSLLRSPTVFTSAPCSTRVQRAALKNASSPVAGLARRCDSLHQRANQVHSGQAHARRCVAHFR